MNSVELEQRLIKLSIAVSESVRDYAYKDDLSHLVGQILRSSSSSALNYGEAQGAESRKDFNHKICIVLKELKETKINLRLFIAAVDAGDKQKFMELIKENDELVAIFYSIRKKLLKHST